MEIPELSLAQICEYLPKRRSDGHKASFGKLQIVAGSRRYPGSALLCAQGAFKAGCGFVYLQSEVAEWALLALPELISGWGEKCTAFVLGPGLEEAEQVPAVQEFLKQNLDLPGVIDAGALFLPQYPRGPKVFTPHPGEAAKTLGWSLNDVQADRPRAVLALQKKVGAENAIVLKGEKTLVAWNNTLFINPTGSVAMATAGQGDLLSGIIGAFLASGLDVGRAASLGVYLHGATADLLAQDGINRGVLAHEVAEALPRLMAKVEQS